MKKEKTFFTEEYEKTKEKIKIYEEKLTSDLLNEEIKKKLTNEYLLLKKELYMFLDNNLASNKINEEKDTEIFELYKQIDFKRRKDILKELDQFISLAISFCCLVAKKEEDILKKRILYLYLKKEGMFTNEELDESQIE